MLILLYYWYVAVVLHGLDISGNSLLLKIIIQISCYLSSYNIIEPSLKSAYCCLVLC